MLYEIVNRFPEDMIVDKDGPLISLYQPTHRSFPENKQDQIVFKKLLQVVEKSLEQLPNFNVIDAIMKPFYALKDDKEFWNHTSDGIAVFANEKKCIVYNLDNPVNEMAVVANSFHIKPILKANQYTQRYLLLGLSRDNFSLFKGNRYSFKAIEIDKDTPRTLNEVLGFQTTDPHLNHGSYGAGGSAMYHGHGDVQQEIDKDTEKYFRYVDSFVLDHYSKANKLPLILVSLTEHISLFKELSKNPYLIEESIAKSIDSMDIEEIQVKARKIIETINTEKNQKMVESFSNAEADAMGSSNLEEIAKAAFESRVETIFIEEDKIIPGKINPETGDIKYGDINSPDYDDVYDDLAEMVLSNGGAVFVLAKDKMPSTTGVAAIYRYKK